MPINNRKILTLFVPLLFFITASKGCVCFPLPGSGQGNNLQKIKLRPGFAISLYADNIKGARSMVGVTGEIRRILSSANSHHE